MKRLVLVGVLPSEAAQFVRFGFESANEQVLRALRQLHVQMLGHRIITLDDKAAWFSFG